MKPTSLDPIVFCSVNGRLRGKDADGTWWTIRWCGNGAYSHWLLTTDDAPERGYYHYTFQGPEFEREAMSSLLEKQIRAAEHKYGVYR